MTKAKNSVKLVIEPISHKGKAKNATHHSFLNVSQDGKPWRTAYSGWRSVADVRLIIERRHEFLTACDKADALAASDNRPAKSEAATGGDADIDAIIRERIAAMLGGADPAALLASAKPAELQTSQRTPEADIIAARRRAAAARAS